MRYLITIQSNPNSRKVYEAMSDAEGAANIRAHLALTDELVGTGELVASEGLPGPSTATLVSVREGRTLTSDGPFAEVKEFLAGFYLVDCESQERVVEIAARVPDARFDAVEVRPVHDFSPYDV
jgi:hypothetical protein